jgi:hypothetical protein
VRPLSAVFGKAFRMKLFMQDPRAWCHPLHIATANVAALTCGILMRNFTFIDDGDSFKTTMGM